MKKIIFALFTISFLSACGGFKASQTINASILNVSNNDNTALHTTNPNDEDLKITGAGELKSDIELPHLTVQNFQESWGATTDWPLQIRYNVKSFRIEYLTPNAEGNLIKASGLIAIPERNSADSMKPLPLLSYQHGTIFRNSEAPSLAINANEAPLVLASMGFAVLAPDYIGFGSTLGTPHPYLQSKLAATSTVHMIIAAKVWLKKNSISLNDQLFLMGYSQGAHVSMAAHQYIENHQSALLTKPVLMVGGGGPYNVQATMDGILRKIRDAEPLLGALIQPGVLEHLGSSVREKVRNAIIKQILPPNADVTLDSKFLDLYLSDNETGLSDLSNVHGWAPTAPVHLFHGIDDMTVPYASSSQTFDVMKQLSHGSAPVTLTNCEADEKSHLGCVAPFFKFAFQKIAEEVKDL